MKKPDPLRAVSYTIQESLTSNWRCRSYKIQKYYIKTFVETESWLNISTS